MLVGYQVPSESLRPGQRLTVRLYWMGLAPMKENFKTFIHVAGPDGRPLAQHDGDPGGGFSPTSRWLPGELIEDDHVIPLPHELPPGSYRLLAGMYQYGDVQNLEVIWASVPVVDGRLEIGKIDVVR
jgi:hypothetical protein